MLAAILLILPGFFSDALAILLLIPPVASWLGRRLTGPLAWQFHAGTYERRPEGPVIDGDAVEIAGEIAPENGTERPPD
jgi:UPF0716 protein FxsA